MNSLKYLPVDGELDEVGLPVDGVCVEVIVESLGKVEAASLIPAGRVERAVHMSGFLPNELHDVDFAASRPADLADVLPEQPKGGPDALTNGDLGSRFDLAIGSEELVLSNHSG